MREERRSSDRHRPRSGRNSHRHSPHVQTASPGPRHRNRGLNLGPEATATIQSVPRPSSGSRGNAELAAARPTVGCRYPDRAKKPAANSVRCPHDRGESVKGGPLPPVHKKVTTNRNLPPRAAGAQGSFDSRREAPGGPRTGPQSNQRKRSGAIPGQGPVRGPLDVTRRRRGAPRSASPADPSRSAFHASPRGSPSRRSPSGPASPRP